MKPREDSRLVEWSAHCGPALVACRQWRPATSPPVPDARSVCHPGLPWPMWGK